MPLELENLHAAYLKDIFVLRGVSVSVPDNQTVIVIGANGSGKSTLLKSIAGFVQPQVGQVVFNGEDITHIAPNETMLKGIGYIPQERSVFPQMRVVENLEMGCWIFRRDKARVRRRIDWALDRFPVLEEKRRSLAGSLSGGQQRMLDIAKALLADPSLLLVDEPSVGLSPLVAQSIYAELERFRKEGRSIFLVDQDIRSAMAIADKVYIMELGRITTQGSRRAFEGDLGDLVKSWLI